MKVLLKLSTIAGILGIGFVLGLGAGATWILRSTTSAQGQREANQLMLDIHTLSELRLGRVDQAIAVLEVPLDNRVAMIAYGADPSLALDPQSLDAPSLEALTAAKAYRVLFPASHAATQPPVEKMLATIPSLNVDGKDCDSGLCLLIQTAARQQNTE